MGTAAVKGKLEAWEQSRALGFRPSRVSDKGGGSLRVATPGAERNIAILDILEERMPLTGRLAITVLFTAAVMMVSGEWAISSVTTGSLGPGVVNSITWIGITGATGVIAMIARTLLVAAASNVTPVETPYRGITTVACPNPERE